MKARLIPPADLIIRDHESVALVGHQLIRLSEMATIIVEELVDRDWVTYVGLARSIQGRLGDAPAGVDPVEAVATALEAMAAEGLVTCQSR